MKNIFFFTFFILFAFQNLTAQEDVPGSSDHPMLSRYPGAYIASYEVNKFQEYTISTGPITGYRYIKEQEKVEGKVTRITYQVDQAVEKLSIGEVYQNNLQALKKAQIEILASGLFSQRNVKGEIGGGSWIGVAMIPNALKGKSAGKKLHVGTSSSGGTFSIVGKSQSPEGGTTYICIYGERHSKKLVVCQVDIVEVAQAELGLVKADANYIRQEIERKGTVSIYGINFDFDSSQLKEDASPAIEEIAKFLKENPKISLYVVGHTDMQGTYEYNLRLSQERAQAVINALSQKHGITASRLIAHGLAFLAPKASNATEEGRMMNRRTELVKRAQ